MKKITLLFLIVFLHSSFSFGQYLLEGFESVTELPDDWVLTQTNATETWGISTNLPNTGSNSATVVYNVANQDETLTSPSIDFSSAIKPRLIFSWNMSYYWSVYPNDNYDFIVSVDDGTNITQIFTEADKGVFDNFTWYEKTIDLSAYVGKSDVKIIFNYVGADGATLAIDDILIEETPSCLAVTSIIATTSSTTAVEISWTAGDSETQWTYEFGLIGYTQGSGTSFQGPNNPVTLGGLTPGATYDFYVQANCGAADGDSTFETVTWTQPLPPPTNNELSGAIPITPSPQGTGCDTAGFTLYFTTDGTTDSGMDGTCMAEDTGLDQFFTWTATTEGLLWNDAEPGGPGIMIRDMAGNEITCFATLASPDIILDGWAIGDDLIIQIYDYGISFSDVAFCLEEYTAPLPIIPNYTTDFSTYPAELWTEASGAFMAPLGISSGFASGDFANDNGHVNGQSAAINVYGTATDEYLISPRFNLAGVTYYLNFDIAFTAYDETAAATFGSDDYVTLLVTEDDTTWMELMRWDDSSTISNTGEAFSELALTGYGADVKFAFYAFSDTVNADTDFFIDNFQITTATLGITANSIENFSLYPTVVKNEISFTSQKIVDTFMVYNLLGQQVFSRKINAKTAALDLTMLKKGIYLVKVTSGNSTGSYKIIKE